MGSFLHPVGPLPPGAYWLRRLLVVALTALLVGLAWWVVGGIAKARNAPTASNRGSGGPSSSPTPTAPSRTPTTSAPTSSTSASGSPASAVAPVCADSVIRVLALTDDIGYPRGVEPKLTIQVSNTSAVACRRDLGQAALELVVTSGPTRVWSSDDCTPGGAGVEVVLHPGQTFASTVVWTRSWSKPGCPTGQRAAGPGTYQVVARSQALRSAPTPFVLT